MLIEWKNSNDAIVWDYLNVWQDLETTDIWLIWLDKQNWVITKWRRLHRLYLTPLEEDLPEEQELETRYTVVKDLYEYEFNGIIITNYTRKIQWLDKNGEVIFCKDVSTDLTAWYLTALNKEIRENQMNVLRELWADLWAETYVNMLMDHYKEQIDEYIEMGNQVLYDAVVNEIDPTILAILAYPTPATAHLGIPDIRTAVYYQITP